VAPYRPSYILSREQSKGINKKKSIKRKKSNGKNKREKMKRKIIKRKKIKDRA